MPETNNNDVESMQVDSAKTYKKWYALLGCKLALLFTFLIQLYCSKLEMN